MAKLPRVMLMVGLLLAVAAGGARAQSRAADLAKAEQLYQQGRAAETMGDAAFRTWVRGINSAQLDIWRNRRNFSLEMYRNAVRLNPAHWRAHERLAFAFHEAHGTKANDELSMLHFVAFLALNPDYPKYPVAKDILDVKVQKFVENNGELTSIASMFVYSLTQPIEAPEPAAGAAGPGGGGSGGNGAGGAAGYTPMTDIQGRLAELVQYSRGEVLGGLSAPALVKPGVFTEAESLGLSEHLGVEGFYSASDAAAALVSTDRVIDVIGNKGQIPESDWRMVFDLGLQISAGFVSDYLSIIGQMVEFTKYLDRNNIAYDARLPRMLVGESMVQLRKCFLSGPLSTDAMGSTANALARYRQDIGKLEAMGGVTATDLWSARDLTKPLPDQWLKNETMEEADKDKAEYEALSALAAASLPTDYIVEETATAAGGAGGMGAPMGAPMGGGSGMGGGMGGAAGATARAYPSESFIFAWDVMANEAYKNWLIWRNPLLRGSARLLGYNSADDFLADSATKVAAGDLPIWQYGALVAQPRVTANTDLGWLLSASQ